jgi:hypothetical protein
VALEELAKDVGPLVRAVFQGALLVGLATGIAPRGADHNKSEEHPKLDVLHDDRPPQTSRRRTQQFTRRSRRNDVVSRESRMRPRSRCNAWFK